MEIIEIKIDKFWIKRLEKIKKETINKNIFITSQIR